MTVTRPVDVTFQDRFDRDADYRRQLLADGVSLLLSGDMETGTAILKRFLGQLGDANGGNASVIGEALALLESRTEISAERLFSMISDIQRVSGIQLSVHAAA